MSLEEVATTSTLPKLACLGPLGTYSHQSAHERFGNNVEYIDKPTIIDVFNSVSDEIPYAVIPQENTIFGAVVETYDALRLLKAGSEAFIRGEVTLAVQHCLLVRSGVKAENVTRIISHEQALGQCRRFLSEHFPSAVLQKTASTALAAQTILLPKEDEDEGESAAICSSICATLFEGLEVAYRGIQNESDNFTRFYILANSLEASLPVSRHEPHLRRALVRVGLPLADSEDTPTTPGPPKTHNRPLHLIMSTLLTTFGVLVTRIDRRPSSNAVPFEDVYFVELEELGSPPDPKSNEDRSTGDARWLKKVASGIDRVKTAGAEATILGIW